MHDVIVIGGGAMGSAAALRLADAGRDVVLLEQHPFGHDLGGSHGATRLFRAAVDDDAYAARVARARPLWDELSARAGHTLLEITGGVDHGVPDEAVAAFRGVVLDPREAMSRWPGMRFETPVLYQPESGRIRADVAIASIQALARAAGAELRDTVRVESLRVGPAGVAVDTPTETVHARQAVVTAGPWSPGLVSAVIPLPRLRVTQEQPRFFAPRSPSPEWPSFVHWRGPDRPVYGLYESGSGVKVGLHASGPEIDPSVRRPPDPAIEAALVRYVEQWFPGLDPERSAAISCLYDNAPGNRFIIDRVGPVTVAAGFSGEGFKFVPLVAEYITDLVTGGDDTPADYRLAAHRIG